MPPTIQDRLLDIHEAIVEIDKLLHGKQLQQFNDDTIRRMATERYLEIVCEATRHLPPDIKQQASDIEWQRIIDFGNRLRHAYHATDPDKVWAIVRDHLPPLRKFVERHLDK